MSFDLSSLALEGTAKINLFHPVKKDVQLFEDDEKKKNPFYIEVKGTHSKEWKKYVREAQVIARKKNKEDKDLTVEELEEAEKKGCELLASISCGAFMIFGGKKFDPTYSNFFELYSNESFLWIKEQVEKELLNRENFIKG